MDKNHIKPGDRVYFVYCDRLSYVKILAMYSHCTWIRIGYQTTAAAPIQKGLFYGFGYTHEGIRHLYLKKWWHYYPAMLAERIRVKLPMNTRIRLKLQCKPGNLR